MPREKPFVFYKTWEIKLMLIDKAGRPRSLKRNRTGDILNQLKIHRKFGSPDVALLELYLHETKSKTFEFFPTAEVCSVVESRVKELKKQMFGYQVLPFGYGINSQAEDLGTWALVHPLQNVRQCFELLRSVKTEPKGGFLNLAQYLWAFAESESKRLSKPLGYVVIAYCPACKKLCLIHRNEDACCYYCFRPFTGGAPLPRLNELRFSDIWKK
jgi:hypothetical protein